MSADTITIKGLADLLTALAIAHEGVESLRQAAADGAVSPREAADELREIKRTIASLVRL